MPGKIQVHKLKIRTNMKLCVIKDTANKNLHAYQTARELKKEEGRAKITEREASRTYIPKLKKWVLKAGLK
jgi:hypothetical protein